MQGGAMGGLAAVSLDAIDQRRETLDADLEAVTRGDRPYAAGRARKDNVAGQQRHVEGDETDQLIDVENELAGAGRSWSRYKGPAE